MTTETELILDALRDLKDDIREVRSIQKEQGEKIGDLCTRTALTDQEVKNEIGVRVKGETKTFKVISIIGTIGAGIISAVTSLKSAGFIH